MPGKIGAIAIIGSMAKHMVPFDPDPLPLLKAQKHGWNLELGLASDCNVAHWSARVDTFDSSNIMMPLNKGKRLLEPVGPHQDAVLVARRTEFRLWLINELRRIEKERQVSVPTRISLAIS